MTRQEFLDLLARNRAKHRQSVYVTVGDTIVAESESADLLVAGVGTRSIQIQRKLACSTGHVVGSPEGVLALCVVCGGLLCSAKGCLETCSWSGCGPVCSAHRRKVKGEFVCTAHASRRRLRAFFWGR